MSFSRRALTIACTVLLVACGNGDRTFVPDADGSGEGGAGDARTDGSMMDAREGGMDSGFDARGIPDGATILPDGAVVLPDGALWDPDATSGMDASNDGALTPPDGSTVLPDGAVILPDGGLWDPDAGFMVACPTAADGGTGCGTSETCGNGIDDDCNGLVDEGCVCIPGMDRERCYDGCMAHAGIGVCVWGYMNCTGTGEFGMYDGHCIGAGRPQPVVCGGMRDYLCDGIIDEGCMCRVGETRPCYTGAAATRNIGACTDGVQRCEAMGTTTGWGTCQGEVLPTAPACDGIDHACDGNPYGGCACPPGMVRSCYDGPTGTSGVGLCRSGMQSCVLDATGASWGPCVGQVVPAPDLCDGIDRLCNGMPDTGCACSPGATRSCYTGPTGTQDVGLCHAGRQTCITSGSGTAWGTCEGEVGPAPEVCDGFDHDCDGMPNTGCVCTPGTSRACYTGPTGTEGVGLCHAGSQLCVAGPGGVGSSYAPCQGEVLPAANQCDGVDRQCNGMPAVGCTCIAGSTRSCYTGPAGTAGVGLCRAGTQTCNATGTGYGACTGQVLPSGDTCDGLDHNCDGTPNTGCACIVGATQSCYDGPAGTVGVGTCRAGTQTCVAGAGGVGSSWGTCSGEVVPSTNSCDGVDRACTGMPYAGCLCVPGTSRGCYTGPTGTQDVGLCHGGTQSCMSDAFGPYWGACVGQQLPTADTCDGLDHTCTGMPYSGCACMPGMNRPCYSGPAGTEGVGACRAGTQMCVSGAGGVGSSWGACGGEVLPGAIVCDGIDHACDGNYPADCPCMPGATRGCYTGPAGTAGVGTCQAGTQTCVTRTGGGTTWGTCTGQVLPAAPQCDGLDHACVGTLPNCAPTVMCPAPVTTSVNVAVMLAGNATAIAPATITSYSWTVISAPAGASYTFSTPTARTTNFTAMNGGVYTVRFTATDSMGRSSSCTVLVTVTARSYLGTEFWAVTTTNSELLTGNTFQFAVAVGNPNSTAVTATVYNGGTATVVATFSIPANSTVTQTLPWVTALSQNNATARGTFTPSASALVANGAYRISTTAPVSAYQFNPVSFTTGGGRPVYSYTNDASLLLPTVALTGNYIALAHQSWGLGGGFVAITGTSSTPTTVTVQLTTDIIPGPGVAYAASGTTATYTLNRGDVVELISDYRQRAATGIPCTSSGQCPDGATCGLCAAPGAACGIATTCCTGSCVNGVCSAATACRTPGQSCSAGSPCCAGESCNGGVCSLTCGCGNGDVYVASDTTCGRGGQACIGGTGGYAPCCTGFTCSSATGAGTCMVDTTCSASGASCTTTPCCPGLTCSGGTCTGTVAGTCRPAYQVRDITGTIITASQPVAVFAGHDCSQISDVNGTCPACDHLEQQMFPTETWSRDVVVTQYQDRSLTEPRMIRVISRENSNTISFTPAGVHAPVTLNRGQSIEFCSTLDAEITSTQPIMVGQFMTGQNTTSCGAGPTTCSAVAPAEGDPSYALSVPTAQYRRDYNFVVPGSYTRNFLTVIGQAGTTFSIDPTTVTPATCAPTCTCPAGRTVCGTNCVNATSDRNNCGACGNVCAANQSCLGGVCLAGTPITGTGWSVWRASVAAGSHQISSANPFGIEVFGVADYTSYIYPGGLDLQTLP